MIYHKPTEIRECTEIKNAMKNSKVDVSLLDSIKSVAIGISSLLMLNDRGTAFAVGLNNKYMLGTSDSKSNANVISEKVIKIRANNVLSAILTNHGKISYWGMEILTGDPVKKPVSLKNKNNIEFIDIQIGCSHIVALAKDGYVYTCGHNNQFQVSFSSILFLNILIFFRNFI